MVNVTRFNPFDDTFDELLRGFFVRPMALEGAPATVQAIRIDVAEDEVHLLPECPGVARVRCQHRCRRRCVGDLGANQPVDHARFQAELFGVGDVLPRTPPACFEMCAARRDSVRRPLQDLDERGRRPSTIGAAHPHTDALARNRERYVDRQATVMRDAVAINRHLLDLDVEILRSRRRLPVARGATQRGHRGPT